jgi:hypothetical protein
MMMLDSQVILDGNGMPTTKSEPINCESKHRSSFDQLTTKQERTEREQQHPEEGRMVYVPKSVLPYIRCSLDWVGVKVLYNRKAHNKTGKCIGHVLDVRILKNGSTEMLVNCHDHVGHRPMWKHTRGLSDVLS